MTACALAAGRTRLFGGLQMAAKADLEQLMRLVAQGDKRAYAQLYDEVAPLVFGVALRVLRDRARAEEVVQEVMVRIWQVAPQFDESRGSVKGWSATMAHRRAVDVVRSVEASRRREEAEVRLGITASFDEPAETVEVEEDRERIRSALTELTEIQQQAIALTYFDGMTYREAAEFLDTSLGTMKTRIRDGLLRLRAILGVDDD